MKKMEFSKIVVIVSLIVEIAVIAFCCYMAYLMQDMTTIQILVPIVCVTNGAGVGFYFNKAKLENKIKLMKSSGVEMTNDDFREM